MFVSLLLERKRYIHVLRIAISHYEREPERTVSIKLKLKILMKTKSAKAEITGLLLQALHTLVFLSVRNDKLTCKKVFC